MYIYLFSVWHTIYYASNVMLMPNANYILCGSDCSLIRLDRLEFHIREELNKEAPRTMVVLHPLKVGLHGRTSSTLFVLCLANHFYFQVVITNLEAGSLMDLDAKKKPDAQIEDASSFYKVSR